MLNQPITKQKYTELIHQFEHINSQYIDLFNSKEYRVGCFFLQLVKCITSFNLMSIKGFLLNQISIKRIRNKKFKKNNQIDEGDKQDNYFIDERIAVYTCIFGNYDNIQEPEIVPDNIDYYIVTDIDLPPGSIWKRFKIKLPENLNNAAKNRYIKMHPHEMFSEYRYSIYIDGSVKIVSDLTPLIYKIGKHGLAAHRHSERIDVYDELQVAEITKRINKTDLDAYKEYLLDVGMPAQYGLLECGVIAREHHLEICKKIMKAWWIQYRDRVKRDQLSLPVVLYEEGISISEIGTLGNNIYRNPKIRIVKHI